MLRKVSWAIWRIMIVVNPIRLSRRAGSWWMWRSPLIGSLVSRSCRWTHNRGFKSTTKWVSRMFCQPTMSWFLFRSWSYLTFIFGFSLFTWLATNFIRSGSNFKFPSIFLGGSFLGSWKLTISFRCLNKIIGEYYLLLQNQSISR